MNSVVVLSRCAASSALALLVALQMFGCTQSKGEPRFFDDQFFHYETVRLAGYIPYGGADTGEVHAAVSRITSGDEQSWYDAWNDMGARLERRAATLKDATSRGRALLRAHNYYRVAELLLPARDEKRPAAYERSIEVFRRGLETLDVKHELLDIPYEGGAVSAIYYPGKAGADERPLLVVSTGFDGTQEEAYFKAAAGALERGYSVLTYEGPGQGAPLRRHGLALTHEWETPTAALLDGFLERHARPPAIVLVGMSLGGYLMPRAAAFDRRVDGVVALGVMYSFPGAVEFMRPPAVRVLTRKLTDNGNTGLLSTLAGLRARRDSGFRWALDNAKWVFATDDLIEIAERQAPFTLAEVGPKITADVLILHGSEDHLVPKHQLGEFQASLTNARSVTTHSYGSERGGQEHCQQGANLLWQEDFFDWMLQKFPRTSQ